MIEASKRSFSVGALLCLIVFTLAGFNAIQHSANEAGQPHETNASKDVLVHPRAFFFFGKEERTAEMQYTDPAVPRQARLSGSLGINYISYNLTVYYLGSGKSGDRYLYEVRQPAPETPHDKAWDERVIEAGEIEYQGKEIVFSEQNGLRYGVRERSQLSAR
jgi:hypothetical protein